MKIPRVERKIKKNNKKNKEKFSKINPGKFYTCMYVIKTKFKRGEKQKKIKEGETRTAIKLLNKSSLFVI